jgi:hypothetical protein
MAGRSKFTLTWKKKATAGTAPAPVRAAPEQQQPVTLLARLSKAGLGGLLGLLLVADILAAIFLLITAANLSRAADIIIAEVRADDPASDTRSSDASANATLAVDSDGTRGMELNEAQTLALRAASELSILATIFAILSACIGLLACASLGASVSSGSRTRLERTSACALRAFARLLVPQALALFCLAAYALARGSHINEHLCASRSGELNGCFGSADRLRSIAGAFVALGALALARAGVTLKFERSVVSTSQQYAEMAELESTSETRARDERRAAIASKHEALRAKYRDKGIIKT